MPRQGSITQYCIHELFEQFHVVQVGKEVFHEGARHLAFRALGAELSSTEPHPSLRDVTCARSDQLRSLSTYHDSSASTAALLRLNKLLFGTRGNRKKCVKSACTVRSE